MFIAPHFGHAKVYETSFWTPCFKILAKTMVLGVSFMMIGLLPQGYLKCVSLCTDIIVEVIILSFLSLFLLLFLFLLVLLSLLLLLLSL